MIHFFNMRIVAEREKLQQVVGEIYEGSFDVVRNVVPIKVKTPRNLLSMRVLRRAK